ncbi:hypothetical protein [Candidatus Lokiarchaeum ossiferum]
MIYKPNGIVVYSTCSLYPEERELQMEKIQEKINFLKLPSWFSPTYKKMNRSSIKMSQLQPHIYNTAGFLLQNFRRSS